MSHDDYRDIRGSDAWQVAMLDPRRGDTGLRRHNTNARWGSTARVDFAGSPLANPRTNATLITTDEFDSNLPIAYQLRFALSAAGPFRPVLPSGASSGALVKLIKSLDYKAGVAEESFTLFPGEQQPSCTIISRKLEVVIANLSQSGVDPGDNITLFVQAAACPVSWIDCREITGNADSYGTAVSTFVAASTATQTLLAANSNRAQFIVQNTSTNADMILKFGAGASFVGPSGTVILPANTKGIYESPLDGYTGIVTAAWNGTTPNGGAIVTEGTF